MSGAISVGCGRKMSGSVGIISSKSELHRLLICAALCDGRTELRATPVLSKDVTATISCLRALGAQIKIDGGTITVEKPLENRHICDGVTLDCMESGSTARFFLPYVSFFRENVTLTGRGKLPTRPMSDLCRCLEAHGARFSDSFLPISISKTASREGCFEISGNISSQYLTGLLFVLPFVRGGSIRLTTPLESKGYVDITCDCMRLFGVDVTEKDGVYTCSGSYTAPTRPITVGGDWSNGAFFLCGGALSGECEVRGLVARSSQPDREIIDILSAVGAKTEISDGAARVTKDRIIPFDIDAVDIPDLVPVLAVLASGARGRSVIRNVSRLRIKESDRIEAVTSLVSSLGGSIFSDGENIYIDGCGSLRGGRVDGFSDHRIVMSAAIAACICDNDVVIDGYEAVTKSYPEFFSELDALCKA